MKISSEQKADIVRRIQVKNSDGTWAVSYKALAPEFGVSSCLISHIAKHAGLPQRKRGKYVPSVGKRYQLPAQLWDMYQELRGKVGMTEARRLIEDHMRLRMLAGVLLLMTSPSPLEDVAHRAPLEFYFWISPVPSSHVIWAGSATHHARPPLPAALVCRRNGCVFH